jgi:hypothetical protein
MNSELSGFFANRDRLRQIDRLHRLLFECLQAAEEEFPERVKRAMDRIVGDRADRWKRLDQKTPDGCTHIGIVWSGQGRWPRDLSVHFGWWSDLFREKPWVGVYTRTEDRRQFEEIQAAVRRVLPQPTRQEDFGGLYPVYKEVEDWPVECRGGRISSNSSVVGLATVLAEGDGGAVAVITEQVQRVIVQLDR